MAMGFKPIAIFIESKLQIEITTFAAI